MSSVSSGSVFEYTMSRSSGLKDTPYAQHQRNIGLAKSMKDDDYMMMKRMNVDSQMQQLRKQPEISQ